MSRERTPRIHVAANAFSLNGRRCRCTLIINWLAKWMLANAAGRLHGSFHREQTFLPVSLPSSAFSHDLRSFFCFDPSKLLVTILATTLSSALDSTSRLAPVRAEPYDYSLHCIDTTDRLRIGSKSEQKRAAPCCTLERSLLE